MAVFDSKPNRTVEERRALLRRALTQYPDDDRFLPALRDTLSVEQVQTAAQRGVFLCYQRADEVFALELALTLKEANVPIWLDVLDVTLEDDWQLEVTRALRACGVLLLVASEQAIKAADVRANCATIMQSGRIVLQVRYKSDDKSAFSLDFAPLDYYKDPILARDYLIRLLASTVPSTRKEAP